MMTPTPSTTTSSSGQSPQDTQQHRIEKRRTRNRIPLSCSSCRHRKLKCNRSNPCENCVRRGDASSCTYAQAGTRKKTQTSQGPTSPDDMQNRIDRLEGLVLSLMTNGAQSAGPAAAVAAISRSTSDSVGSAPVNLSLEQDDDMIKEEGEGDSDIESVSNSFGILKVDSERHKSMYFGDSHWHMVLADIAEVKNYFSNHKKEMENHYATVKNSIPTSDKDGPAFLFQAHKPATELELRGEVPAKSAVDKLVTRYFNSHDPAIYILHAPTFRNQLYEHWQDPSKTSIVWLALLYAILCLAMQSYHKVGDEPPEWKGRTLELAGEFRLKCVQCLVTSDYTKSVDNTIEALILYIAGEFNTRWDAEVGIWVIIGMIVRLSMRMGYHRDPKNFSSNITPFQAEMRRRIWTFVRHSDIMFSFQLALPGMIRSSSCDTELPSNIFEDEFGPESAELPPSRPASDATPVAYMILKARIAFEFGEIVEAMNTVSGKPITYEDILRHDSNLREIKANMPSHLRARPLEDCTHEPATLLMERFSIDIFWHKCMCVLHRKYLTRARRNPRYSHSRRTCVESSMEILRAQSKLTHEAQPEGRLRSMRWFISALTKHDFLLAAMLVCLDLHYEKADQQSPSQPAYDLYFWTPAQRAEMFAAVEESFAIWKDAAASSVDAFKAAGVLETMLKHLKSPPPARPNGKGVPSANGMEGYTGFDQSQPEHSAAMTLGMLSSGGLTPDSAAMFAPMPNTPGVGNRYNGSFDLQMGDSSTSTASGQTPNFSSANPFGTMNGPSPFSVLNNIDAGPGMVEFPENLDWEAWDSYIQNNNSNIDPAFYQFGTVNMDGTEMQTDPALFGPFMGASPNTPGRN